MNIQFVLENGQKSRIVTSNKGFWDMVSNYTIEQINESTYCVLGRIQVLSVKKLSPRERLKAILHGFAVEWQYNCASLNYSIGELCNYQNFFEEYGRKYGLLKEFRENGLCWKDGGNMNKTSYYRKKR